MTKTNNQQGGFAASPMGEVVSTTKDESEANNEDKHKL
jgi:hypothetical protein